MDALPFQDALAPALDPRSGGGAAVGTVLPDLSWTMEKRMRLEAWTFWMRGPPGPGGFCPGQGRGKAQVQGGPPDLAWVHGRWLWGDSLTHQGDLRTQP